MLRWGSILTGLVSHVPGTDRWVQRDRRPGASGPRYGYGVWLKHISLLHRAGMRELPQRVIEIGPGQSLAVGLTALLCGAERYLAVDVVRRDVWPRAFAEIDTLATLLRERAPCATNGWPSIHDCLDENRFPRAALCDDLLSTSLSHERISAIKEAVRNREGVPYLRYEIAEPPASAAVAHAGADLLLSQAVMQHANDPRAIYEYAMHVLRPGGFVSHEIPLTAHAVTREWNGHWSVPPRVWRLTTGRRRYFLNRLPCSAHLGLMREIGFEIVAAHRRQRADGIRPEQLAEPWKELELEDMQCDRLFVVARKPPN